MKREKKNSFRAESPSSLKIKFGGSCCQKQLGPHVRIKRNVPEEFKSHGRCAAPCGMRAHEVVVCDEEHREGHGTVEGLESSAGSGMELIGSVEALDYLLEASVFAAFLVEVLQADNSPLRDVIFLGHAVVGHCGAVVGRVSVGDKFRIFHSRLFGLSEAFAQESERGERPSVVREVEPADRPGNGIYHEPRVVPDRVHDDVCLVGDGFP